LVLCVTEVLFERSMSGWALSQPKSFPILTPPLLICSEPESSHRLFVREGEASLAPTMALRNAAIVDHRQSFDEIVHQRLKQAGYDLPRLRMLIGEALSSSVVIPQESAVRWQETTGRTPAL